MAASIEMIVWQPAQILSNHPKAYNRFALVVLNQPLTSSTKLDTVWSHASLCVGADGGANRVLDLNVTVEPGGFEPLKLDVIIGDLDSIRPDAKSYWEQKGAKIIHDPDQYSTDFAKALKYIRAQDALKSGDIICIGGLGGRVDQGLSQLHHLYMFQKDPTYQTGKVYLLSSQALTFVLLSGKHEIEVAGLGKHVGIIPLKEPSVITTKGLEWDVTDWQTEFGGQMSTSNHVKDDWVYIETTKDVLFTIDLYATPNVTAELLHGERSEVRMAERIT